MEAAKDEIERLRKTLSELENSVEDDSEEGKKYELLQKRDQEMTSFMDSFDESRSGILREQEELKSVIVALLEHISKGIDESTNMPSRDALGEMKDAKSFKQK
jgi:predicted RNase H-like nuclease (RuvC/YqgF family)